MYAEIGTASGVLVAMGVVLRFMNAKIDRKQNKDVCDQIHTSMDKSLESADKKFDKIMDKLEVIREDNAAIKQHLKHLNGIST